MPHEPIGSRRKDRSWCFGFLVLMALSPVLSLEEAHQTFLSSENHLSSLGVKRLCVFPLASLDKCQWKGISCQLKLLTWAKPGT